ncbi:hypothetical protein HN911_09950 [Candidatus Bathyarchaeota archaeon]|nr:hypothetical protein [Candidatus Bathyarchaeota archaeon]
MTDQIKKSRDPSGFYSHLTGSGTRGGGPPRTFLRVALQRHKPEDGRQRWASFEAIDVGRQW